MRASWLENAIDTFCITVWVVGVVYLLAVWS